MAAVLPAAPATRAQWKKKKKETIKFARARVKNPMGYSLGDQKFLEASCCKYLGIILRRHFTL
jgi:hypothetical protein